MSEMSMGRKAAAVLVAAGLALAGASAAAAQSSASTYSYGTYNPVQAAINRNSMNAAILKQATGSRHKAAQRTARAQPKPHH